MSTSPFCSLATVLCYFRAGTLDLRASCFTLRVCLRMPLEGRFTFFFSGMAFMGIAPYFNSISKMFTQRRSYFLLRTPSRPG